MNPVLLVAVAFLVHGIPVDSFEVQAELQGLYDEMSQATIQFTSESEIDEFHDVALHRGHQWKLKSRQQMGALTESVDKPACTACH